MSTPFREEAIPLVTIESDRFNINPTALEILRQIPQPIVVVGVAGLYRTGKSYLLNRIILNREKGFGVAGSINACTKGIWLWGRPLKAQTDQGEIVNLVVLDSEGLGAIDQDSAHDCRIFALVLLLSSVFVYNSIGALDESAIENLSLVINLTKHIRIKATETFPCNLPEWAENQTTSIKTSNLQSEVEQDDSEEFAAYFPSFLWVLRDFALQLVDEDGESLTPRQYLENSLAQRPGLSDDTAHKNRIRRLIQSFFRERDCFTLVRPLTDEQGLKRLEELPFEQLRPEFVFQALELRKRLLSLNRKKIIKGREISGEALSGLLTSYVSAINGGAVPNIEGAWTYICQQQGRVLADACVAEFLETAKQQIEGRMPLGTKALSQLVRELKTQALERFKKESILAEGDGQRTAFESEIRQRIKEAKQGFKADNDQEFEALFLGAMNAGYSENVYPRITDERITEAKEVSSALQELRRAFEQVEPEGPRKAERLFRFLFARSCEAHGIVWKNREIRFGEKLTDAEKATSQKISNFEAKISSTEEKNRQFLDRFEQTNSELHTALFEKAKLEQLLSSLKSELSSLETESSRKRAEEKAFHKSKQDDLSQKLEERENALRALEKKQAQQKSNFETELALLSQQLEFHKKQESELAEASSRLSARHKKWEEEASERQTKMAQDFETRLKAQAEEIALLKEQRQNMELQLSHKINVHESIFKDFEEKEDELKSFINTHERTILSLREQLKTKEAQTLEHGESEQQISARVALLEEERRSLEQALKAREDKIQILSIALEKEKALNKQNGEFFEIKQADLISEIEELKRLKESAFQALQNSSGAKSDLSKQLQDLRLGFEERIKKLTDEFEAEREALCQKLARHAEKEEAKEKEFKKEREELRSENLSLKSELDVYLSNLKKLEEKVAMLEKGNSECLKETELFYLEKIARLEAEIEQSSAQRIQETVEARQLLEESIHGLKQAFEAERARLERRLSEEKAKFDLLNKDNLDELEKRRKEEIAALEEEVEALTLELQAQDLKARASAQKLENEAQVARAKQEAAEKQLLELRLNFERELLAEKGKSATALQLSEQERRLLAERLEQMKAELSARALEVFQLRQTIESLSSASTRQLNENEKTVGELLSESVELKSRIEALIKDKYQLNDELIIAKTQLSKEAALGTQRADFFEKRASDLSKALELAQSEIEELTRASRSEKEVELAKLRFSLQEEIALWESRYEEKKRSAKEIETALGQKLAEAEKSRCVLQERLGQSDSRREELEKRLQIELGRSEAEMTKMRDAAQSDRRLLLSELEQTRKEKYELEIALAESTAKFDKDRAVAEGKLSFFEQQVRKLKSDLAESQASFDAMFQKFHQFRVADKEETEQTHGSYVLAIEQRYSAQLTDLKEQNKALVETYKEKMRALEKELRRLEQTNQELSAGRLSASQAYERKLGELLEAEKKSQEEVIRLKKELEKTSFGAQKEFEREKEALKNRVFEAEGKAKKLETERGLLALEYEKQRTKWHIEKDQLLSLRGDTLEQIDRLQKQKESLARDNEKLKGDLKALKKTQLGNNLFSVTKMNNRSELFSVDKSLMSPKEYVTSNKTGNSSGND